MLFCEYPMRASFRLYSALSALALGVGACFMSDALTSVQDDLVSVSLSVQPSLGPLAVDGIGLPINRIHAAVTRVPEQELVSEKTMDVDPDANAWAVELRVPASLEGTLVVVSVALINLAGDGAETVLYSGSSDPINLTPAFSGTVAVPLAGIGVTGLGGNVYVAATGAGLAGATVEIKDAGSGAVAATVSTDTDGGYQVSDIPAGDYRITASAQGFEVGFGFASVFDGLTTTVSPIGLVSATGPGDLSGTVQNAINTSEYIGNATVELRVGAGAPDTEPVVASTTTDAFGTFSFAGLAAGNYTIRATAEGFADGQANVFVQAGLLATRTVLMSPGLVAGELRTVLTWGPALAEVAEDLDSHLTGPHDGLTPLNGTYHVDDVDGGRFHIYYSDPGTLDGAPGAVLHNDDTSYEGPETTTIGEVFPGTYRFTVDLFCCTTSIRTSQARVQVFGGQGLLAEFNAPNQDGQTWIVFDLVNGQIVPINRVVQGRYEDTPQHLLAHPSGSSPVGPAPASPKGFAASHPKSPGR